MELWQALVVLTLSYLLGSIPFGLIVVKIAIGKDVRNIESGRTGGTNVMRAAGVLSGFITAALDVFKGFATAWIVQWFTPGVFWLQVAAPLMAVLGHNYSVFLAERDEIGRLRLRGGAGGATALGGAMGIWPASALIILPLGVIVFLVVGYASVATISVGVSATLVFLFRSVFYSEPWEFVFYGIGALLLCLWALRPNLQRLRDGTERMVGLRVKRKQKEA